MKRAILLLFLLSVGGFYYPQTDTTSEEFHSFKKLKTDFKKYSPENFNRNGIRLYTSPEQGLFSIFKLIPEFFIEYFSKQEDVSAENYGAPFLVIGHRGSPTKQIENTINSFRQAMDDGANAVEMDLCITKDKRVVVWHDWTPNELISVLREAGIEPEVKYKPNPPEDLDKRKKISSLTYDEFIQNYSYSKSGSGEETDESVIPDLKEAFKWASGESRLRYIFFDVKTPGDEAELAGEIVSQIEQMVKNYNSKFGIVIETTDESVLLKMKESAPDLDYSFDTEPNPGLVLAPQVFSSVQRAINYLNRSAIPLKGRDITIAKGTTLKRIIKYDMDLMEKFNRAFPDLKIKVFVTGVINDREEMEDLLKLGVDGMQTDHPDILHEMALKYKRKLDFSGTDLNSQITTKE